VTTVPDGAAALDAARADPPDLVLTDVMMPRLDGFGLLTALRNDERTRTIPVVMLSARAGEEARADGVSAGADDYLVKPFTAQELIARVSGSLALGRLRREAAQQLEAANRALEAAARAKSRLLASMSHEIRTPMNAIIGMTSLMMRSELSDEQRSYAHVIRSSGDHLLNMISDILDLSKIEAAVLEIEEAPFDVAGCVREVIDICGVAAASKRLEFTHSIQEAVPEWVCGDAGRLRQILINLLTNAVKYTEEGRVTLTVSATPPGPSRTEVRFAVSDTGMGIAESDQAHLFDAFVQVDSTTKYEGVGLGLSISARLAELMGGEITLRSEPGAGSTFELALPLAAAEAPAPQGMRPAAAPHVQVPGKPLSILVVDDEGVNRRVIARLFAALGHGADVAGSGMEAIEALERQPYDLLLMDMEMPGVNGLDATRTIRERWPRPGGPCIVGVTGWAGDSARNQCLEAGMDDYLAKPIDLDDLTEVLERVQHTASGDAPDGQLA
jgi:signal transduction histidine kinase